MLWDFSIGRTVGIVARTWPFLVLRLIVFGITGLIFVVMAASGGVLGHELLPLMFTQLSPMQGGIFGLMGGIGFGALVVRIVREYTLYIVKAAHIAVIVRLLDDGALPQGESQLGYGWRTTRERFVEASLLFGLDQMIKAALAGVRKLFDRIGGFVPGLGVILSIVRAVVEVAVSYVDEIILAHNIRNPGANPWRTSADAVVLYAQNGRVMLRNAAWLALFLLLAGLAILAAVAGPFALMLDGLPGPNTGYGMAAAVVAAIVVINVVLEPIAFCALLQVYDQATRGQTPDPAWARRLEQATPAFSALRDHPPEPPQAAPAMSG